MQKVDSIEALFNGVRTSFPLAISGVALSPGNAAELLVVYNGVIQEAGVNYSINLTNVVFINAPLAGRDCFICYSSTTSSSDTSFNRIAGEALGGFRVVYGDGSGSVFYASADAPAHSGAIEGITMHAAVLDDTIAVLRQGQIIDASLNLTPGILFLGVNGTIVSTPPVSGMLVQVGLASTSSTAVIDVQPAILRG